MFHRQERVQIEVYHEVIPIEVVQHLVKAVQVMAYHHVQAIVIVVVVRYIQHHDEVVQLDH
jgi:hypothetical protein